MRYRDAVYGTRGRRCAGRAETPGHRVALRSVGDAAHLIGVEVGQVREFLEIHRDDHSLVEGLRHMMQQDAREDDQ
ncbi:MAG: hypothetical protein ACK55I_14560, partial [bacterium]